MTPVRPIERSQPSGARSRPTIGRLSAMGFLTTRPRNPSPRVEDHDLTAARSLVAAWQTGGPRAFPATGGPQVGVHPDLDHVSAVLAARGRRDAAGHGRH